MEIILWCIKTMPKYIDSMKTRSSIHEKYKNYVWNVFQCTYLMDALHLPISISFFKYQVCIFRYLSNVPICMYKRKLIRRNWKMYRFIAHMHTYFVLYWTLNWVSTNNVSILLDVKNTNALKKRKPTKKFWFGECLPIWISSSPH